ncbi:MAG: DUF2946 family protein [Rhizomicrobium sp.]|jgi:hypothetical protein
MVHTLRQTAVHLALAAMLFRALMPAGWMPDTAGHSGSPIVICTLNGPLHLTLGEDGKPLKQEPAKHQREACPFAAMPHLAQAAGIASLALPSPVALPAQRNAYLAVAAEASRHSPQSPRAPPSFA